MIWCLLHAVVDTTKAVGGRSTAENVESWATVVGIFVAGLWTYLIFVRQRQRYPRASVAQKLSVRPLPIERNLYTVSLWLSNIGATLIEVDYVTVLVQQLAPLSPADVRAALRNHDPLDPAGRREILWYRIGYRRTGFKAGHLEVEPGETEQLNFDFVLAPKLELIKVDVHIENVMKRRTLRDKLRDALGRFDWVSIRATNRCLGWQCVSYYDLTEDLTAARHVDEFTLREGIHARR